MGLSLWVGCRGSVAVGRWLLWVGWLIWDSHFKSVAMDWFGRCAL